MAGGRYYNRDNVAAITLGMSTKAAFAKPAQESELAQSPNSDELVCDYAITFTNIVFLCKRKLALISRFNDSDIVLQIISMEWGNFRSSHLPLTPFDTSLDAESSNPGNGVKILESQLSIYLHYTLSVADP